MKKKNEKDDDKGERRKRTEEEEETQRPSSFAASLGSHRKPRPNNPERPNLGVAPDTRSHQ